MKTIRRLFCIGICLCIALAAAGCGNTQTELPDLSALGKITVIAREEGSGTKAEFENLIGTNAAGVNQIAAATDEAIKLVETDQNAIGYTAYSSADSKAVKILRVNGIKPDETAIKKEDYPLCRNYYAAYMGELNPAANDFLTYVMGAGQALVSQSCIPVGKTTSFLSDKSAGEITITGSSSAAPLMQQLAEDYCTNYNPNAVIHVESTDSASGLTAAIRGECDIAMSSRSLKEYEAELLTAKTIAADGIAVVVNKDNPLENLSMQQLKQIYDGDFEQWNDLK